MPVRKKLDLEDLWGPQEVPIPTFEQPQQAAPSAIPLPSAAGPRPQDAIDAALGHWSDDAAAPKEDPARLAKVTMAVIDEGGGGGGPAQEDDPLAREAELVASALMEGPNQERVQDAYAAINELRATDPEAAARLTPEAVAMLLNGVADPRSDSDRGQAGVLGVDQVIAAAEALMGMPDDLYQDFTETLNHAGQDAQGQAVAGADAGTEQALLLKALAARRDEIQAGGEEAQAAAEQLVAFGEEIRGEERDDLIASTTLIDIHDSGATIDNNDALMQAYTRSCAPTVAIMALGEMDPIFARQVRDGEVDPAAMQLDYMNLDAEKATRRDGTGNDNSYTDTNGTFIKGAYRELGAMDAANIHDSQDTRRSENLVNGDTAAMNAALEAGQPVPLRSLAFDGHFMLATDVRVEGETTQYLITDPWTGQTAWVSATDLSSGNFSDAFGGDEALDGTLDGIFVEPT